MDRALRSEVHRSLTISKAWPKHAALMAWVRAKSSTSSARDGMRNSTYGHIRRGFPVPPQHLERIVDYYIDRLENRKVEGFVNVVTGYLATKGVHNPLSLKPHELLEYLVTDEEPDAMMGEFGAFTRQFGKRGAPLDPRLVPEHAIDAAALWVFVEAGRTARLQNTDLPEHKAIAIAEEKFGISLPEYADHLRTMRRVDPWTLLYAMGKNVPTGFTSIHPVTEAAYLRMRRGEMATYEIREQDMTCPSRFLVFEAIASNTQEPQSCSYAASWHMLHAVFSQVAGLTYGDPALFKEPIFVLAPGGTAHNEMRLIKNKYKKVADKMGGRDIKVYERILKYTVRRLSDMMFYTYLVGVGNRVRKTIT